MNARISQPPANPWRRKLFRVRETLRWQGVRGLAFRALMHSGYRSAGWFVRPLDAPVMPATARVPADIVALSARDAEDYHAFQPSVTVEEFRSRLASGHHCFAARCDGRIGSVVWVAVGRAWIEFFEQDLPLGPREIYFYNAYTDPKHRGRHLQPAIVATILSHFKARGFERAFSLMGLHNRPIIHTREQAGFRRVGMMGQVRIGSFRQDFFRGCRDERGTTADPRRRLTNAATCG